MMPTVGARCTKYLKNMRGTLYEDVYKTGYAGGLVCNTVQYVAWLKTKIVILMNNVIQW